MIVFYNHKILGYSHSGHPESPDRVTTIYDQLRGSFPVVSAFKPASTSDVLLAHTKAHLEKIRQNTFSNPDTPNYKDIAIYTKLASGAAIKAAHTTAIKKEYTFSLMRPPGHHAGKSAIEGFCYTNHIAIATLKLLQKVAKKVAILDIDAHHGNGTQDIVHGNRQIIYCSIHQLPLYPNSGRQSEDNCFNSPVPLGTNWDNYHPHLLNHLQRIKQFKPDVVGVSLGFDTYEDDQLTNLNLRLRDFHRMGKLIAELQLPTFFILEGGYSDQIGECARHFFASYA